MVFPYRCDHSLGDLATVGTAQPDLMVLMDPERSAMTEKRGDLITYLNTLMLAALMLHSFNII